MCTATLREPERGVLKKGCNLETALTGHTGTESVCLSGIRSSSGECSFHSLDRQIDEAKGEAKAMLKRYHLSNPMRHKIS